MTRCGTCNVEVNGGEELRAHYNSEVHLTNVRRRVEGLRPLTAQEHRYQANEEGTEMDPSGAPIYSCTLCKKTFHSVQTLQTHVRSTTHLMKKEQRIIARDSEAASMLTMTSLGSAAMGLHRRHNAKRSALKKTDNRPKGPKVSQEDRDEDTSELRCFFCGNASATMEANIRHLRRYHQFTIPMEDRCTDVAGLLCYIARKVNGLMCLVCNEKTRSYPSLDALRDHMREADHEKIVLGPDYQEFYACALEDPGAVEKVELEGVQGSELVLAKQNGDKKRVVMMRESEVPRPRARETGEETDRRRAITASEHETLALVKQEQREMMAAQNQEQAKMMKRQGTEFRHHQLKVNLRSNKLHPKGYDGEGLIN